MCAEDHDLHRADVQRLSSPDQVAAFFAGLGYDVGARVAQSPAVLGITAQAMRDHIAHVELIASQDDELYVYLFEMKSLRVSDRQGLARAFRNRAGNFLLILTAHDYQSLDFLLLERIAPEGAAKGPTPTPLQVKVRTRALTVDRQNPSAVALRVLRRFTYTEPDPDYQYDKLLSAYTVAEWSEPLYNNRALFSDYYLNLRLCDSDEWTENPRPIFDALRTLVSSARKNLTTLAATRSRLLEPALQALGFAWQQDGSPDYTLFRPGDADAPLALCLAYPWNRYLDGRDEQRDPERPDENPGARVVSLLDEGAAPYVIVTNGKLWRLYAAQAHSRATNYYEIDLEEALASPDRDDAIRYFWLFFRADAFTPAEVTRAGETRRLSFLDRMLEDSATYAKELGERLKARVFEDIFPHFAEGFIAYIRQQEGRDAEIGQERLDAVYQGTLTFLYRLMFLLYAEARDLLPVHDARGYHEVSLAQLKAEIASAAGAIEDQAPGRLKDAYRADSTALYDRLARLFAVIDQGDPGLNVPRYNGGLFLTQPADDDVSQEAADARFLRQTKIPDRHLALGLDRLARDVDAKTHALVMIDFKSLGVRQLGSIYEGLLEFKLRISAQKMAIVRGKRTEEIVPYRDANPKDILTTGRGNDRQERTLPKGAVYLENTRQERKATGSYYTPDYIVKYIVAHTVGPVLEEKFAALTPRLRDAERRYHQARNLAATKGEDPEKFWNRDDLRQLAYDVLDIKVLDPAMGSGHFLVEVVDFITDRLLNFLNGFPNNPVRAALRRTREAILDAMEGQGVSIDPVRLNDVALLKRQALKRCVYGVDLNPMAVELAKVSLWLDAFTLGAPLSFLDHHLRCGNSLIGAMAKDADAELARMGGAPGQLTFLTGPFAGLLRSAEVMRGIGALADATIDQVHESAALFRAFEEAAKPYKQLLDVFVIRHFGVKRADEFLRTHGADVMQADAGTLIQPYREVLAERERLYWQYRFFHWDLEFPEVFIDLARADWKQDVGFDAVVGNPPYLRQEELSPLKPLFSAKYEVYQGSADLFLYFYERGLSLLRRCQRLGYITSGTYMNSNSASAFRRYMHENARFETVVNFGENQPFQGAEMVYPTIAILRKDESAGTFRSLFIEGTRVPMLLDEALEHDGVDVTSDMTGMEEWRFQAVELTKLIRKITEGYPTLGEVVGGRLYSGIKTGLGEAFVISDATREKLIREHASSAELIRPFLRGQDLRPWYQIDSHSYLIFTFQSINIEAYPAIRRHLERFRDALAKRSEPASGQCEWYELRPCSYYDEFAESKIFWPDIAKLPRFSWDERGLLCNDKGFIVVPPSESVLSILNSRPIWFALSQIATPLRLRAGLWQYQSKVQFVERLPIPRLTAAQELSLSEVAEAITAKARERYAHDEAMRRRIAADLGQGGGLNTRLEEWWTLEDISDLRREVEKAFKRHIPPGKLGEWERFLPQQQAEHQHLTEQLIELETRMNAVVYDAFKLESDEIALIEDSTKYPYGSA